MTQTNQPTALAAEQQAHLHKTLRRFDIVFLLIAAVVGLETLGQVSLYGAEAFTWALVLAVFFLGTIAMLQGGITAIFAPFSFAIAVALVGFEIFVSGLQAFIFAILTASYIGGAMAEEH